MTLSPFSWKVIYILHGGRREQICPRLAGGMSFVPLSESLTLSSSEKPLFLPLPVILLLYYTPLLKVMSLLSGIEYKVC